jgi:glycosyltransferase involved in cell wall biosynthesis
MNVLFLQKRLLYPVDAGWRIRTLNIIRHLARWHRVTYLCNAQAGDELHFASMRDLGLDLETEPWVEAPRGSFRFYADLVTNVLSPFPFTVDKDFHPALRARAHRLLTSRPFDVVVCDFVQMARNVLGLPMPASVLFQHNVEAQVLARHAHVAPNLAHRAYMRLQHAKMRRFEGRASREFDIVVAVSPEDRRLMESAYGLARVRVIDTAVDIDTFTPAAQPPKRNRIVFVGSLDWFPNEDGLRHFATAIWPLIRQARPDCECEIVGRRPSPAVGRITRDAGLRLLANVPDIRPSLSSAVASIVPLRIGGGTRLKIVESMAMGTPVVSTTIGAEGLPLVPGRDILIEDEPRRFADAVVHLMSNEAVRAEMAARGRSLVVERFSAESVARQFEAICTEAVSLRSAWRPAVVQ